MFEQVSNRHQKRLGREVQMKTKPYLLISANIGMAALLCAILTLLSGTDEKKNDVYRAARPVVSQEESTNTKSGKNAPGNQSESQTIQHKNENPNLNRAFSVHEDCLTLVTDSSTHTCEYEAAVNLGLGIHTMSGYVYSRDEKPLSGLTILIKYVWEYTIEPQSDNHFSLRPRFSSSDSHEEFPLADGTTLVTTWHSVAAPINGAGFFEIHNLPMVRMKIYLQKDIYSDCLLLREGIYPGSHTFYAEVAPTK